MKSEQEQTREALDQVLDAWSEQCRQAGIDSTPCHGVEARFLVAALASAVATDAASRDLGRAARGWGDRFTSPVDAIACLAALRDVVVDSAGAPPEGWSSHWLPVSARRYNRIVDQLTAEAVDSASTNLRAAARTDALTGCANRLALNEDLERALTSAKRSGLDFSVAMIDLDGLKQINDTRGHEAGDLALAALAATLQGVLRGADRLYRIGGDEFVVITPFTDSEGARTMLRRAESMHGPSFSWGVASLHEVGPEALDRPELLLGAADASLYAQRAEKRKALAAVGATAGARRGPRLTPTGGIMAGFAAALVGAGALIGFLLPLGAGPTRPSAAIGPYGSAPTLPVLHSPTTTTPPAASNKPAPSHLSTPPASKVGKSVTSHAASRSTGTASLERHESDNVPRSGRTAVHHLSAPAPVHRRSTTKPAPTAPKTAPATKSPRPSAPPARKGAVPPLAKPAGAPAPSHGGPHVPPGHRNGKPGPHRPPTAILTSTSPTHGAAHGKAAHNKVAGHKAHALAKASPTQAGHPGKNGRGHAYGHLKTHGHGHGHGHR